MGYHWNVLRVSDANDLELLAAAIEAAKKETERPTLIIVDSHIGWGAPNKHDTADAHGEPLGEEEIQPDQEGLRLAGRCPFPSSSRGKAILE